MLVCICVRLVSECAPPVTQRLPPTAPSLAGWPGGVRGERDLCCCFYHPLGSCWGGGLAGRTAAAAGSCLTCWLSQECSAVSLSRVFCSRLCLTFAEKRKQACLAWKEVALHPQLYAGPAGPAGAAQDEHLLLQLNATAGELDHITFVHWCASFYTWYQDVRQLDVSPLP